MPRYSFRAVDAEGAFSRGQCMAANENELFQHLRTQGLSLVDCRQGYSFALTSQKPPIPLDEQALLFRHLHALTRAGVPAHVALDDILSSLSPHMQECVISIRHDVLAGMALSAAFKKSDTQFDALVSLLLQGGEKAGRITDAFRYLEETLRWKNDVALRLRRQLGYPLVQIILGSLAVTVLMTVAVPQIILLLDMMGGGVPAYASALLFLMNVFGYSFVACAAVMIIGAFGWNMARAWGGGMAVTCDRFILRLPIVGPLFLKLSLARLTHVFAALLGSGIGVMESLTLLPETEPNKALAAQLRDVRNSVNLGQPLSAAFTKQQLVPPYVIRLLRVGEDGGKLAETLRFISDIYSQDVREELEHLIKIISLFITVGVGLSLVLMVGGAIVPLYRGLGGFVG